MRPHPEWMRNIVLMYYDTYKEPNAHRVARRMKVSVTWVLRVVRDNRRPVRRRGRYLSPYDPALRRFRQRNTRRKSA